MRDKTAPAWMRPYGLIALGIAVLGFIASSLDARGVGGGLHAGFWNPLFLLGMPLAVYWIVRSTRG